MRVCAYVRFGHGVKAEALGICALALIAMQAPGIIGLVVGSYHFHLLGSFCVRVARVGQNHILRRI